jgi:hypothetical protein
MPNLSNRHLDSISQAEIERWITPPRFRAFLEEAKGDYALATALYDWNISVSAVFFEALSYAEVLLRNVLDAQMEPVAHHQPASRSWLCDPNILNDKSLEIVSDAIEHIEREKKEPTRARVVAKLSFGFWRALLDKRYKELWIARLHRGFPNGTGDRAEVARLLSKLNPFRNRIAHHEPILNADIARRHEEMIALVALMDREAAAWVASRSSVPALLAWRPPLGVKRRLLARVGGTPRTTKFHHHL